MKKSIDRARELYQEAADQDCELAQNFLGSLHFTHDKDFNKAVKYFKLASKSGKCARALNNLGLCYEMGPEQSKVEGREDEEKIIEADPSYAAQLYLQSARLSYTPAMVNLAQLLFKSAQNNRSLVCGNQKFLTHGEAELFGDD